MLRLAIAAALAATTAIFVAGAAWSAQATPSSPRHLHGQTASGPSLPKALAPILANARVATAKYANNLALARKDGYTVTVTQMIPDMGWHFMNPAHTKFDVTKPPILVYEKRGDQWLLGAFEWVFTQKPAKNPIPGATYGSFGAACHYKDGMFVFKATQEECAQQSPQSGSPFAFWHPDFVTLHLWVWYPNPEGVFSGMNPLVKPFNKG